MAYALWKHWSTQPMFEELDKFTGGHWRVWSQSLAADLTIHHTKWVDADDVADTVAGLAEEFKIIGIGLR